MVKLAPPRQGISSNSTLGPSDREIGPTIAFVAIAVLAVTAYSNSFHVPFIFDDQKAIETNPHVRHLLPVWEAMTAPHETTVAGRPMVCLSFAVNYAISGDDVWSYHAINLLIHVAAGLVLFGVLHRTLSSRPLRDRFGSDATALALAITAIWIVHPLNTMCVTYIVQRAESMLGLCYLLTLYCVIRSHESTRPFVWQVAAVAACLAGMGSKEAMATAPIVVFIYDATFLSGTFSNALRRRGWMYLALAMCWIPLGLLVASGPRTESTGMSLPGLTPWEYLRTQPGVILYYMRLTCWPWPLCLDYDWPIAHGWIGIVGPGLVVLILLQATARGAFRRWPWSFLGVWFFGVLAVSSSFVPIVIIASEHRMYLPSAAIITGVVLLIYRVTQSQPPLAALVARRMLTTLALLVVLICTYLVILRNKDYQSPVVMWNKVVEMRPNNSRALNNLGAIVAGNGNNTEAMAILERSVTLSPRFAEARYNYGVTLAKSGQVDEAMHQFQACLRLDPRDEKAEYNLGYSLEAKGKLEQAVEHFRAAIGINPDYAQAQGELGLVLKAMGNSRAALDHLRAAFRLQPELVGPANALAWILATDADPALRNASEAIVASERASDLTGGTDPHMLDTLAAAYAAGGRFADAVATGKKALAAAENAKQNELAQAIRGRIEMYRQDRPFRAP